MSFVPIEVDRDNFTILGVQFPSQSDFLAASNAIGSSMYEGYVPTSRSVELIRDAMSGKISTAEMVARKRSLLRDRV